MSEFISIVIQDNLVWAMGGFFCGVAIVGIPWAIRETKIEDKQPNISDAFL